MEYFWWLYLATRLDSIQIFFGWMLALSIATTAISIFIVAMIYDDSNYRGRTKEEAATERDADRKKIRPWRRAGIVGIFFFGLLAALTPNKKDAMFIAGGIGVIEAAKAVQGSEIAKKSVAIVEQWLSNNLTELQKKGDKLRTNER